MRLRQRVKINVPSGIRDIFRATGFDAITDDSDGEMFTHAGVREAERAR